MKIYKKKILGREKGITLIALVITIIVLLILAGVSISMLTGDNGILTQAQNAKEETEKASLIEQIQMDILEKQTENSSGDLTKTNLKEILDKYFEDVPKELPDDLTDLKLMSKEEFGKHEIEITDIWNGVFSEDIEWANGSWNGKVNTPNLKQGMEAVYWDEDGNEVTSSDENFDVTKWYDYDNNKWANAKTSDGSYWVWIPRYEYQVINNVTDSSKAGIVNVNFIPTSTTTPSSSDYYIHPAFRDDSDNHFSNGGWDSEIPGFWVAKYEMSMEDENGNHIETTELNGNVGLSDTVKMVSKPGVTSWRYINIANSYTNSYNYNRTNESHLIKNSEWGAVAFLTHSRYGRDGQEVKINDNSNYYTGGGSGKAYKSNTDQSSTQNITGVYDLNGGANEGVATFNKEHSGEYFTKSEYLDSNGKHFAKTGEPSTKYATAYSNNTGTYGNDFSVGTVSIRGDTIQEVYVSNYTGWFGDCSNFVILNSPIFNRGGDFHDDSIAGIFCSGRI